jgi:RimJ/RimL family protein N-acetyltransferase
MDPKLLNIPTHFSSERLLYRSYTPDDGEFYYRMLKDNWDHLYEFMPSDLMPVKSKEDVALVFEKHQALWNKRKLFLYGIGEKSSQKYVGETYLANPDWAVPRIEIGYFIVKESTGRGFQPKLQGQQPN